MPNEKDKANVMRIVADSACDVDKRWFADGGIEFDHVPLGLQLGDVVYIDDENFDRDTYMEEMAKSKIAVKSAAPSPEVFLDKFKKEGSVFVVTLSHHLSASYTNAMLAKQMYLEDVGNKFIHVFDSLSASAGETLISLKIMEAINSNLSENEIVEKITHFIDNMKTYFILERYDNLVKNGRIGPYVATLASLLSIRPICYGDKGKMAILDKARGTNKAFSKLIDHMIKDGDDKMEEKTLAIAHVKCLDKALQFKEEVLKRIRFKEVVIVDTGGLCSTYADKNGLVIAY